MSVDVSVIVPVYNTEPYFRECLDSLVNQTLKNVEFIFVDDGSTDRSYEILQEYQQRDDRIRILRQQNLYAGVARNNGMKVATGKYIIFLDSDDFFELDMLEKAFNCAEENQAEIVIFDFWLYDDLTHNKRHGLKAKLPQGVFTSGQLGKELFCTYYNASPWNKLFLASFIRENKIEFQEIQKCNDTFFTHMAAVLANRMVYLDKCLVSYRVNNPSSLQGRKNTGRECFIEYEKAFKMELKSRGLYTGAMSEAYKLYAIKLIRYHEHFGPDDMLEYEHYYDTIKNNLIPYIFDSIRDFDTDSWITHIYCSESFSEFLYRVLQDKENTIKGLKNYISKIYDNTVSKKSKDYRIGHTVLAFPRAVKRLIDREQKG